MTANFGFFANFALAGVIVTSFAMLFVKRPEYACLTLIMASILFLPQVANFQLPKMPPLTRDSLPYLCLLVFMILRRPASVKRIRMGRGLDLVVLGTMVAALFTANSNRDPLVYGRWGHGTHLPGLVLNDGFSMAAIDLVEAGIPFILGRLLIRDVRVATRLLVAFAVGGLIYSFLILIELRMSPQIHTWVYGFAPRLGDWAQSVRGGGYRPKVFMTHPLALGLLMFNSVLAAFALSRAKQRVLGWSWKAPAFFLLVILALCKCTAALIYALIAIPMVLFTKPRTQLRVGVTIAVLVLSYPILRGTDIFPTKALLSAANAISADREGSLAYRFDNEDVALAKARQRVVFGWGTYGRNWVYEPMYGNRDTVLDGEWIILLGMRGVTGMLCHFLLLLAPLWMALRAIRDIPGKQEQAVLAGTATMLAFSTLDLLPNGLFVNYPFFLAGALVGMTRVFKSSQAQPVSIPQEWSPGGEIALPGVYRPPGAPSSRRP